MATVTVFSLVLSPFGMIAARRLQARVEAGRTSWRDMLGVLSIRRADVQESIMDTASRLAGGAPPVPAPAPEQDSEPDFEEEVVLHGVGEEDSDAKLPA